MMISAWKRILLAWIPALAIYAVISFLSSRPNLPRPAGEVSEFLWFKSGHLMVYAVLTWWVVYGWLQTWNVHRRRWREYPYWWITPLGTVIILAVIDEVHQMFVPGRGPHIRDVFIDTFAAVAVLWAIKRYNLNPASLRWWWPHSAA